MIRELLNFDSPEFKKYVLVELCYIGFDVIMLAIVNAVLGQVLPPESNFRNLLLFLIGLLLNVALYLSAQKMSVRMIETSIGKIRWKIIETIENAGLRNFEQLGKAQIYNALTLDAQNISDVAHILRWIGDCSLLCCGLLTYQFLVCKPAFCFTLGIFGLGGLIYAGTIVWAKKWMLTSREKETELFAGINDLVYGFKELKLNDQKSDDFFQNGLKTNSTENRRLRIKSEAAFADSNVLASLIECLALVPIVFIIPAFGDFSIHALAVSVTTILFFPFNSIKDTIPYLVRGWISVDRIEQLTNELKTMEKEPTPGPSVEPISDFQNIQFEKIGFAYSDKEGNPLFSVRQISLSVRAGEILFITGGNGSGKSTLLKIITGLYAPITGSIRLDGREVAMADCRHLFAVIFTDYHLFDRLYGLKDVDGERVQDLLRRMELDAKVTFENGRFSTLELSTGQKKRLALLAALLENKPIYVFDEWAADQDPHFREQFYHSLLPGLKKQGKTVIAVTHDERYFHTADQVIKLDYGAIHKNG